MENLQNYKIHKCNKIESGNYHILEKCEIENKFKTCGIYYSLKGAKDSLFCIVVAPLLTTQQQDNGFERWCDCVADGNTMSFLDYYEYYCQEPGRIYDIMSSQYDEIDDLHDSIYNS